MRFAVVAICTLMVVTPAEADVGIGISAKTDSATVYIPVTVRRFMFEPYVRATDRESETLSTIGTDFPVTTASASGLEARVVGLGVFRLVPFTERVTLYYGGRLARIDEQAESFTAIGATTPPPFSQPSQSSTADGRAIIPTLGFHYNVVERLSIGGEIGLDFSEVDLLTTNRSQFGSTQTSISKVTTNDTHAEIILRFFF
jgi:hypothetical protein